MREFMEALESVNAVADDSPGFVWRLQTDEGNATALHPFDDAGLILNMSVWESIEALRAFVYSTPAHLTVMKRRREWFERTKVHAAVNSCVWNGRSGVSPITSAARWRRSSL